MGSGALAWGLSLLLATPALEGRLAALAGEERRRAEVNCAFKEHQRVEELDGQAGVVGLEVRTYVVTAGPTGQVRRLVETKREGKSLNPSLRHKPEDERPPNKPLPFAAAAQPDYRFSERADGGIAFRPHRAGTERATGHLTLTRDGHLETLALRPSALPPFVHEALLEVRYGDTACGRRALVATMTGDAGLLFLRVRFRSQSRYSEFSVGGR